MSPRLFETQCRGDTMVVTALAGIGSLPSENGWAEADGLLKKLGEFGARHVIFDLGGAGYFGTFMLELMLALWRHIRPAHGEMALCNVSETGREVLRVTRLDTLWPVRGTLAEAVRWVAERSRQEEIRS